MRTITSAFVRCVTSVDPLEKEFLQNYIGDLRPTELIKEFNHFFKLRIQSLLIVL
jgi:hypothetical protein